MSWSTTSKSGAIDAHSGSPVVVKCSKARRTTSTFSCDIAAGTLLAQDDGRVVSRNHGVGIQVTDPLPLLEQLVALGAEVLGQVHLVEVLGQRADAVAGDHDQSVVGVDQERDQPVAVPGRADPSQAGLDLALFSGQRLDVDQVDDALE